MPEFDQIAPVYDETRGPPPEVELEAVVQALLGKKRVLEAGVGTGRYAARLQDRGHEMTGVDISREMMRRAREKGVSRLLLGDVHHLPFRDGTFDASMMVHVLQLLPDPAPALRELGRVATSAVVSILPDHGDRERGGGRKFRTRYRELAAQMGYPLPERPARFWENSQKVLQLVTPKTVQELEFTVERDPARAERRWKDARTFGGLISVPPEVHEKIIAELRKEFAVPDGPWAQRQRKVKIVTWDPAEILRALPPA